MSKLPKDFRYILMALNSEHAKYLVVGGYAVSVHSEPRATKDIDLWIKTDVETVALSIEHLWPLALRSLV